MRAARMGALLMAGAAVLAAAGALAGGYRLAPTGPAGPGWTACYLALFATLAMGAWLTGIDRIAGRLPARRRSRASFQAAGLLALLAGLSFALSFGPMRAPKAAGFRFAALLAACVALAVAAAGAVFLLLERRTRAQAPDRP